MLADNTLTQCSLIYQLCQPACNIEYNLYAFNLSLMLMLMQLYSIQYACVLKVLSWDVFVT